MTKKKQKEICKSILQKGNPVSQEDQFFLIKIILRSEKYVNRFGIDIKNIFIKKTEYGNHCFYVENENGFISDFSYIKAVDGKGYELQQACRLAVRDQVMDWRVDNTNKQSVCSICGSPAYGRLGHIDHYPLKFKDIFKRFDVSMNFCIPTKSGIGYELIEPKLEEFRELHGRLAQYRLLCVDCNLRNK